MARFACVDCGKSDAFGAGERCCECHNAAVYKYRSERKAVLAEMPRCEATGCAKRGNRQVGGVALLCGRHANAAQAAWQRTHACALFAPVAWTRDGILALAETVRS